MRIFEMCFDILIMLMMAIYFIYGYKWFENILVSNIWEINRYILLVLSIPYWKKARKNIRYLEDILQEINRRR